MSTQLRHHVCCGWSSFESAQKLGFVTKTRRIWSAIGRYGESSYADVQSQRTGTDLGVLKGVVSRCRCVLKIRCSGSPSQPAKLEMI